MSKKKTRSSVPAILFSILFILAVSCNGNTGTGSGDDTIPEIEYSNLIEDSSAVHIVLKDNATTADQETVSIDRNTINITAPGTYCISGSLSNGYIQVNSNEEGMVRLVLDNVSITHASGPAIAVLNAEYTAIMLADGSRNHLEDGSSYGLFQSDDDPDATLYSKDDLVIFGKGSLTVTGHYGDGIKSKDRLLLDADSLQITAVDDGLLGRDALIIKHGAISVDAGGDGLKTTNDEDADKGYIYIEQCDLKVDAATDAIAAETNVYIANGYFDLVSGGGEGSSLVVGVSAKGIKAGTDLLIDGGYFVISSADDAVHANETVTINDGDFQLATNDDGIHADTEIEINGGDITIRTCYEGIESCDITLNDGNRHINYSYDDGINISDGSGGGGMPPGPPGGFNTSSAGTLVINGGYTYVNAKGDGIDINGDVKMTGGTLIVDGPTTDREGPLDYDRTFVLTGGTLIAAGSAGMAQAPGSTSTQNCIKVTFSSNQSAGKLFHLQNSDGDDILDFSPVKYYRSVVYSSSDLIKNTQYEIYSGGSCSGEDVDGCYLDGSYTPGSKLKTFTVSNVITSLSVY